MKPQRLYRSDVVVMRRQDLGEADRILTLYSPTHGKLRAVAKGARRPKSRLGGHVELFTHVNVLVAQGRNLDIVTQAETVRAYPNIRTGLWRAAYAAYAVELVDGFTEERLENEPIFDLLLQMLNTLEVWEPVGVSVGAPTAAFARAPGGVPAPDVDAPDGTSREVRETSSQFKATDTADSMTSVELSLRNFELRLLGHLGYAPELFRCVQCGEQLRPGEHRFSPPGGGMLCAGCAESQPAGLPISVNAIKAMRLMSQESFGVFRRLRLPAETALEVERVLRSHISYILDRQLRTREFLDHLRADRKRERRAS